MFLTTVARLITWIYRPPNLLERLLQREKNVVLSVLQQRFSHFDQLMIFKVIRRKAGFFSLILFYFPSFKIILFILHFFQEKTTLHLHANLLGSSFLAKS